MNVKRLSFLILKVLLDLGV